MSVTSQTITRRAAREGRFAGWLRRSFDAAGIEIGGGRDWDPIVHDRRVYRRVATRGSLGLGESCMDGHWDCTDLGEIFRRLIPWRNRRTADGSLRGVLSRRGPAQLRTRLRAERGVAYQAVR